MNSIIEILMNRDGMSKEDAINKLNEVRTMISDADYNIDEVEDIIMMELGLEMDYIDDILFE